MPNGSVNLSKVWQVPLEQIIKENLFEGKLMSALNMVQATGKGYKELIEYQLQQKKWSDMKLLERYFELQKPSYIQIVAILEEEKIESPVAIQRLLE